jgi:hypothetical protein
MSDCTLGLLRSPYTNKLDVQVTQVLCLATYTTKCKIEVHFFSRNQQLSANFVLEILHQTTSHVTFGLAKRNVQKCHNDKTSLLFHEAFSQVLGEMLELFVS